MGKVVEITRENEMVEQDREIQENPEFWLSFIMTPQEIFSDPDLTAKEMLLFGIISAMDNPEKGCFASNQYLGAILNVSGTTISIGISKLKEKGYIIDNGLSNHKRILHINEDYIKIGKENTIRLAKRIRELKEENNSLLENQKAAIKFPKKPPLRKLKHKNIRDNSISNNKDSIIINNRNISTIVDESENSLNSLENDSSCKKENIPLAKKKRKITLTNERKLSPTKNNIIPIPDECHYITLWNSFNLRQHKPVFNNQGSQTYIKIKNIFKDIENGSFLQNRILDPEFLKKHNISTRILNNKLSPTRIKDTINKLRLLFIEGYWGYTINLKKDLSLLLWNPNAQSSMFYAVLCNQNLTIPNADRYPIPEEIKEITEKIYKFFPKRDIYLTSKDKKNIVFGVQELEKSYYNYKEKAKKYRYDPGGRFSNEDACGRTHFIFIENYLRYIDWMYDEGSKIHAGMINTKNWMFGTFLNYLYDEFDLDFREK